MAIESSYYDAHLETMPRADIERMQEARLLRLLPYAYQRSALIRHVWQEAGVKPSDIRCMADFREKAPFIDKAAIQSFRERTGDPTGGLSCVGAPHMRAVGFTSGTTGDPLALPRGEFSPHELGLRREYWHIGARPGDFICSMQFTFRRGQHGDRFSIMDLASICLEHHPRELPRLVEAIRKYRPTLIHMLSTPMLLALERYLTENRIDPAELFSCLKGALLGGEPVSPRMRALVDSWGLELFEMTSLGDIQGAIECRAHDGMHAWEDSVLVECLEPGSNRPVTDGQRGELVVTSLADDIAPLIRYRSEDLISLNTATCSCGRTHARFKPMGRAGDELLVQGKSVLPRDITTVIEQVPETVAGLFQIVRPVREVEVLKVRAGFDPALLKDSESELAGRLVEMLQARLEVPVVVELRANDELLRLGPPHKIPRTTKV
ncbi:MAG: hypothetical protein RBT55_01440 [Rhodocyclaceae bacterium]|jgi:phenylacetate-CoA ligase|nr:hypothetical protein [Rhodocyclaceae bacterium]